MKKLMLLILLLSTGVAANAQQIPALSAKQIIARTTAQDTVYIVNFWATWCPPCVAELPEFNALQQRYAGRPVKILLVSLDFKEDYPFKLARFLERKRMTPEVVWMTDTNPNVFIPLIEESWEGSIPATAIVHMRNKYKKFVEGSVTERQIATVVDKLLTE